MQQQQLEYKKKKKIIITIYKFANSLSKTSLLRIPPTLNNSFNLYTFFDKNFITFLL